MSKLLVPTTLFSAKYAPKQLLTAIAQRYILYSPGNPILPKIRYMCDNRDRNTLWWRVSTASLSSHKKVVRSWCARRARAAFTHEMKARGYDAEGKRIRSDTPLSQTVTESSGNMKGTLTIYLSPASLEGDGLAWRKEMGTVVDALIQKQQWMLIKTQGGQQGPRTGQKHKQRSRGKSKTKDRAS